MNGASLTALAILSVTIILLAVILGGRVEAQDGAGDEYSLETAVTGSGYTRAYVINHRTGNLYMCGSGVLIDGYGCSVVGRVR